MAKRQGLLQQKDIRKLLCAILGLISPAKFDSSCTSYISRYISHKRMSSLKHITWHIFATYLHFKRKKRQKRIYMLWSSLYVCILISHIANIYRFNIQCYLPIHNLLIHYPRRFTVSYLFLKTSNSRINKKKPPNSRINEKKPPNSRINEKKPTNSRLYYSELRGKSRILYSRISNSRKTPGPKKRELGGNTVYCFYFH